MLRIRSAAILSAISTTALFPPSSFAGATDLPLLAEGSHISTVAGAESLPIATQSSVGQKWAQAIAYGMDTARIQLDWATLEPAPLQYDAAPLLVPLVQNQSDGLQTLVSLNAITAPDQSWPADLVGLAHDHPLVLIRFKLLLDWVVPALVSQGGYALSIGNEPGELLNAEPTTLPSVLAFASTAIDHAHGLQSSLAMTITFRESALGFDEPHVAPLMSLCDVACFNYFGQDPTTLAVEPISIVPLSIGAMLAAGGDRPLILQEVGCPAGPDDGPSSTHSNPIHQRQFLEAVVLQLAAHDRFRAAYVFQLPDVSPTLSDWIVSSLPEYPPAFLEALHESLRTLGMVRYEDGSSRPVWDAFLNAVETLSCDGSLVPYGYGFPGTGEYVPNLIAGGCASPGHWIWLYANEARGGAGGFLAIGTQSIYAPLANGLTFWVGPLNGLVVLPIAMSGVGPGNGEWYAGGFLPAGLMDMDLSAQAFISDAGASGGFSATNGLQIKVR